MSEQNSIKRFINWVTGRYRCPQCNCRMPEQPPPLANGLCITCFALEMLDHDTRDYDYDFWSQSDYFGE